VKTLCRVKLIIDRLREYSKDSSYVYDDFQQTTDLKEMRLDSQTQRDYEIIKQTKNGMHVFDMTPKNGSKCKVVIKVKNWTKANLVYKRPPPQI